MGKSFRQYRTNRRTHLAYILFRHLDQIFLDLRQQACVKFSQSDEKARCFSNVAKTRHGCREIKLRSENTDGAICARYLCCIAFIFLSLKTPVNDKACRRVYHHSMSSTGVGCSFITSSITLLFLRYITLSAMGAIAELCVTRTTVMPRSRQVSCSSFSIIFPVL